jgi:hypothetical protein
VRLVLALPDRPGLVTRAFPPAPLPFDLEGWRARVVGGGAVLRAERLETEAGWPYTRVISDVTLADGRTARRVHALYEVLHFGAVALVHGAPAVVDAAWPEIAAALAAAGPDFAGDEAPTLAALWEWP